MFLQDNLPKRLCLQQFDAFGADDFQDGNECQHEFFFGVQRLEKFIQI
jgi:hypothetical protein